MILVLVVRGFWRRIWDIICVEYISKDINWLIYRRGLIKYLFFREEGGKERGGGEGRRLGS